LGSLSASEDIEGLVATGSPTDLKMRDGDLLGVMSSIKYLTGVLVLSGRLMIVSGCFGDGTDES